jgi:tetratricopeptide (TPR) repeat protein
MPDARNKVRRKEEEEKTAQTGQQEEQGGQQQQQSKGLQYTEDRKPAPVYNPQYAFNVQKPAKNEDETKAELENAETQNIQAEKAYAARQKTSSINIAQILKDFRSTASAIGTPENLKEEVDGYLALIDTQVRKDEPDAKIIRSNLKTASVILDKFISKTLDKESKVVENWVDALFLQQIDYKYNEGEVNPQFLVQFPKDKQPAAQAAPAPQPVQPEPEAQTTTYGLNADDLGENPTHLPLPQDKDLKSTFLQAKKLAFADDPKKAIQVFQKVLARAQEIGDTDTESKIFFEVGKIYDDHDHLAQALKSYNNAVTLTTDPSVKTKAHFSMGQIYDDTNNISPALDHYFNSISFGGEAENLVAQSTALAKIGNIYTDMFEDSIDYFTVAEGLAEQTDNAKIKGYVSSSLADAYEKFGEPKKALQSYSGAIQHYTEAESPDKVAQNYMSAAEVMLDYNNPAKAASMLKKAKSFAEKTNDDNLKLEVEMRIASLQRG